MLFRSVHTFPRWCLPRRACRWSVPSGTTSSMVLTGTSEPCGQWRPSPTAAYANQRHFDESNMASESNAASLSLGVGGGFKKDTPERVHGLISGRQAPRSTLETRTRVRVMIGCVQWLMESCVPSKKNRLGVQGKQVFLDSSLASLKQVS